ncbi:MAG: DUF4080 domain-containing protein, partial [Clostridiales bacterium]
EIEREKPDILAFSLYIWNIVFAAGLLRDLRLLLPDTLIVAGGPEPSGHPQQILAQIPELDALFLGEGEESWPLFLRAVTDLDDSTAGCGSLRQRFMGDGAAYAPIPGLLLRSGGKIAAAPQVDLARQPFLYSPEDLARLAREKRVIYYESSRGCPYCCSFCASATESLRERPLELVLEELPLLAATGGQVKFIDRTFNARPQRAIAITEKILSLYRPGLSWHFELAPAACSGALADLLGQSPPGYFHLEAGVQTLYPPSLKAVGRNVDWPQAEPVLQKFAAGPCRLHVDLIAGLPYETPQSFSLAFQALHRLNADYLQLGFLKILPGSLLAQEAAAYGLVYSPRPPYQILYTPEMSSGYLFGLHRAERALNAFYNKGPYRSLLMEKGETWPGGALAMYFALAEGLKKYPSGLSEKTAAVIINECFGNS